ncbi:MAG: carboxymuconolactone decarboxylase family protein [Alphaproteobacteria bacterium]|nr:carboxymuconolactone decarboxylase family protein [Alphaproteobacteria bacterium]NCQ88986.1 carboxymuconolactone decarboxylase family protein [Alphaproteobacteria bacterium]NCT07887.1 carboxymuconolactone decarboxylase family protein [Alphaproteobacteria bacterium]
MTKSKVEEFKETRDRQNEILAKYANINQKKFYGIDAGAYQKGALDKKTKELLGFTASLVLRCDDCILYHLIACKEAGVTSEELSEAVSIGMLVGGSITIPHIRRAMTVWDEDLQD